MENKKFEKINEQEAEVITDQDPKQEAEKAVSEVQAEKKKMSKKTKIIAAAIGGTVVVGLTIAGVVHYVKKGKVSKAVATIDAAKQAIPELAQTAVAEAAPVVENATTDTVLEVIQF